MSQPFKARTQLDKLPISARKVIESDFDFEDDEDDDDAPVALGKKTEKGRTRSDMVDWDYEASKGHSRAYDPNASKHSLVAANLPLAKTIANDFSNIPGVDPEDIMVAAKEALYFAVDNFVPGRSPFPAWLSYIIRQRLQHLYNIEKAADEHRGHSLDAPLSAMDGDTDNAETVHDHTDGGEAIDALYGRNPDDALRKAARVETWAIIRSAVEQLDPFTQRIMWLTHGPETMSARDIAELLNKEGKKISGQSVWNYLKKGTARVKQILSKAGFVATDEENSLKHRNELSDDDMPEEELGYADRLLAKKAAREREKSSASESRYSPRPQSSFAPSYSAQPSTASAKAAYSEFVAVMEVADGLLEDAEEPEHEEAVRQQWDDLVDAVEDKVYSDMVQDQGQEDDVKDRPKAKKTSESNRGQWSARFLTDRLLP